MKILMILKNALNLLTPTIWISYKRVRTTSVNYQWNLQFPQIEIREI